ncbi:MAG: hypothetical protein KDD65_18920 [Bacteroidetes bacterium]|nr:hypothetical protein [Bacteroidota bacterium]
MRNLSRIILAVAVAAFVLGFVFGSGLLHGLAVILLVAVLVIQFGRSLTFGGSSSKAQPSANPPHAELADLGIIEIRPKNKQVTSVRGSGSGILSQGEDPLSKLPKSASGTASGPRADSAAARRGDLPAEPEDDWFDDAGDGLVSAPRPVQKKGGKPDAGPDAGDRAAVDAPSRGPRHDVVFALESMDGAAVVPLLESALASLTAETVVLLSRIAESSRYRIAALVSDHPKARAGGQFTADAPYLPRRRKKDEVVHLRDELLDESHSRYYDGTVTVAQQAIVPIAATTGDYLFIADWRTPQHDTERVDPLMLGYAAALRALLSSSTMLSNAAILKTSEIVSRALSRARAENTPLAMALVCMKDGERFLASERDVVLEAEQELESVLDEITSEGRIEKLADLTFGVFLSEDVATVEQWALKVQEMAEKRAGLPDLMSRIVSSAVVGVAMLSERHQNADDLREDALAALEESFQSGACTILE